MISRCCSTIVLSFVCVRRLFLISIEQEHIYWGANLVSMIYDMPLCIWYARCNSKLARLYIFLLLLNMGVIIFVISHSFESASTICLVYQIGTHLYSNLYDCRSLLFVLYTESTQRTSLDKAICSRLGHVTNAFHELLQAALPIGPCIDVLLKAVSRLYVVLTLFVKFVSLPVWSILFQFSVVKLLLMIMMANFCIS